MTKLLYIPTESQHAFAAAENGTRFSLAEIQAAGAAANEAIAAHDAAYHDADEALTPFKTWALWEMSLEGSALNLYLLLLSDLEPSLEGGTWNERYPIRKWEKGTRQLNRVTAKIRRAIANLQVAA